MEQAADETGIELFICIPVHSSDPLFLRELQQGSNKRQDFRSVKRQARLDKAVAGVSSHQADAVNQGDTEQMDVRAATCSDDTSLEEKQSGCGFLPSPSSSLLSSPSSLSSSVSDLFTFDENDVTEFSDERIKPRFRLLTEFY